MSLGMTKKSLEEKVQNCLRFMSIDEGREIKTCKECPMFDSCSQYARDYWAEAIEKARRPDGRFGKLYQEERG